MEVVKMRPFVEAYYGEQLKSSDDLQTSACCTLGAVPGTHSELLKKIHPDVLSRFYGCGSPIPDAVSGAVVLDLGCGTGRDCFLTSPLVGPSGRVIGVDMTDSQLSVAKEHEQYHADIFFGKGATPNTDFRKGYIEDLKSVGLEDASVDVVISNCAINLTTDKKKVFAEVARVLRDGGEFFLSDMYADRRLPEEATKDKVLWAECLGGALYLEDFRRMMADVGFNDLRVVSCTAPTDVCDQKLRALVSSVVFRSMTIRAFKIPSLEDRRENFGQFATYTACGPGFKLDADYVFEKGVPLPVDGNTAAVLQNSCFKGKFSVTEPGPHQGMFSPELEGGALAAMIHSARTPKAKQLSGKDQGPKKACC